MQIEKIDNISIYQKEYQQQTKNVEAFNDILKEKINNYNFNTSINPFENTYVSFKVGDCDVSRKDWDKEEFPFWDFFDKNTQVDTLSNWNSNSIKISQTDIQKNLKKINFGEVVIVIPENLEKKMIEDESFAEKIYQKISAWKKNYDAMDNAIAANNGIDTSIYQLSKSYCISLDENGEIENYAVVSGGIGNITDDNSDNREVNLHYKQTRTVIEKVDNFKVLGNKNMSCYKNNSTDYTQAMSILASSFHKSILNV